MDDLPIPTFKLEDSAKKNFKKSNKFMQKSTNFEDVKRCRWTFEGYLKSCGISERELKRKLNEEGKASIQFEVGS